MLVVGTNEEMEELLYFFLRTLNGGDRTNNIAEAAHRRLKYELGTHHPTNWKLIDGLRKVQKGRDGHHEKLLAGHQPPQKQKSIEMQTEEFMKLFLDLKTWILFSA